MAKIHQIKLLISQGKMDEAAATCTAAIADQETAELHGLLGYVQEQTGQYDLAITSCERAIALGDGGWGNLLTIGRSLHRTDRHREAIETLTKARALDPANSDICGELLVVTAGTYGWAAARRLRDAFGKDSVVTDHLNAIWSSTCLIEARRLVAEGEHSEAEAVCLEGLDADETWELRALLGYVKQQGACYDDAVEACRRAIALGGLDWSNFLVLGRSLIQLDRPAEAAEALFQARWIAPDNSDVAAGLLEAIAFSKGLPAARLFLDSMLGRGKSDAPLANAWSEVCAGAARRLLQVGDLAGAESTCMKAIAEQETGALYVLLGFVQQQTGRDEEAIASCNRAVELGVNDWSNFVALGRSLCRAGRVDEGLIAFVQAHEKTPDNIDVALMMLEADLATNGAESASALFRETHQKTGSDRLERAWWGIAFEAGMEIGTPPAGVSIRRQQTVKQWALAHSMPVQDVEGREAIPVVHPQIENDVTPSIKTTIASNDPYVAELSDVSIVSGSHLILSDDGQALNETGAHAAYGQYVDHHSDSAVLAQRGQELLVDVSAVEMDRLDAGIMLSGVASDAWGHWSVEYLPRLQFLEHHPDFMSLPIIVDEEMPQSHFDSLASIASNSLIKLKRGRGLRCGRLIYAPPPTFFPVHVFENPLAAYEICPASPRAYRYVKQRVEARLGVRHAGGGKYYLSRRNSSWRRTYNEAEVSAFLESDGFEIVTIEDLTFEQQVRLFQDAACIVAPIGSSLQNLIFASTDVRLIILSQSNIHNQAAFNGQMGALGYSIEFVLGRALGDPSQKHADFSVPIHRLRAALASRRVGG